MRLCLAVSRRQRGLRFKEESQHFLGGVGAVRIGVSPVWAAAGPGMAASVDEPLLNNHGAGLIPGDCAGMRSDCGVSRHASPQVSQKQSHGGY